MTLPYDVRRNPTWIGVERAKANIRDLAANRKTIGLICGGAGTGKNTLTRQIAKQHLIKVRPGRSSGQCGSAGLMHVAERPVSVACLE